MYDELNAADEALALGISELPAGAATYASRTTARHARHRGDLLVLLDALGLPADSEATTPLLPLIPAPDPRPAVDAADCDQTGDQPVMPHSPAPAVDAFEAVAVSMHHSGYPTEAITNATGLTEQEITTAVAAADSTTTDPEPTATETELDTHVPAPADHTAPDDTTASGPVATMQEVADVDVLLLWAEQHSLASVRATAGRIRQDLADLDQRRATEQATAEVEARIAKLQADLEAEKEHLRQLKADRPRVVPATIEAPTPIRHEPAKRSREELAAIRTWAREHGYQVGVAGVIKASIVAAYDDAHQSVTLAKVG